MEDDLSLSQSLGGLRIANPDNLTPSSTKEDSITAPASNPSSSRTNTSSPLQLFRLSPANGSLRSHSPLDFNPASFSLNTIVPAESAKSKSERPSFSAAKERHSYSQRQAHRQSIPFTYQDQQQAQFPQYPTMMPLSQRRPSSASRPVSTMYPQANSVGGELSAKEGAYRSRNDPSRVSAPVLPQRSSSKASTARQSPIFAGEGSNMDQQFRSGHLAWNGTGQPPQSKASVISGSGYRSEANPFPLGKSGSQYGLESGLPASSEEWQEKGAAVGIRAELDANGKPVLRHVKKGVKDFNFGRTLGEGSYSTVVAATDRQTHQEYAIKVLDKKHIIKEKKVKYVNIEKDTLNKLTDHPGVVRLYYTFQDMQSLYFVLDLASSGELLGVLKRMTTFDEECTRFYGAQILDTVDYMHSKGVIHRDLKPENVLLDVKMHVKVTDFGTAKILEPVKPPIEADDSSLLGCSDTTRASSFVGTAEYVSPELLTEKNACKASDLWAFGCIIYQLLAGRPPFKAANEYLTFQKITKLEYEFPVGFPEVARDLVERLLVLDPSRRLAIEHIKNHQFFSGIKWGRGLWKQKAPKLKGFVPQFQDHKNLNGHTSGNDKVDSYPPNIIPSHSTAPTRFDAGLSNGPPRPGPRLITELPPPSQLDIEWSPILTDNERILKLGNLSVLSSPSPHSVNTRNGVSSNDLETPKKFSRFFGSSTPKKRQRLVMVTSSARIVIVAAGGEEKKAKAEVSLLSPGCSWKTAKDSKGSTNWVLDTVTFLLLLLAKP